MSFRVRNYIQRQSSHQLLDLPVGVLDPDLTVGVLSVDAPHIFGQVHLHDVPRGLVLRRVGAAC